MFCSHSYLIYTQSISRESNHMNGLNIYGTNIKNIRYVDDTTLLANSNEDPQKIVDVVKSTSEQKRLDINVKKTKTMVISKNEDMQEKIKVDGKQLKKVEQFYICAKQLLTKAKVTRKLRFALHRPNHCSSN